MSANQSYDGLSMPTVERSSHLEEYTRTRPASAGSRPRSLLNKLANAASAVQCEDDDGDPADAEPWVLEGWGDGPSVTEAACQAALKLAPYLRNVPTTLVGLGAAGTRRVASAGPQGRSSPLKASEARRKVGSVLSAAQAERRTAYAASPARRPPPPANMDLGDESDVEVERSSAPVARRQPAAPSAVQAGRSPAPAVGGSRPGALQPRQQTTPQRQPPAGSSMRQFQQSLAQQLVQNTPLGPRTTGRPSVGGSAGGMLSAAASPQRTSESQVSPARSRQVGGGEALQQPLSAAAPGTPVRGMLIAARAVGSGVAGAQDSHHSSPVGRPPPHPPALQQAQHQSSSSSPYLHSNLDPCGHAPGPGAPTGAVAGSSVASPGIGTRPRPGRRLSTGPSDPGGTSSPAQPPLDSQSSPVPRSSSFSSAANRQPPSASHETQAAPHSPASLTGPPPLPGLLPVGRRGSSFRADSGLGGWDTDGPPTPTHGSSSSLWVGPTGAAGNGSVGLQAGTAAPLRRDQLQGASRLQRDRSGTGLGIQPGSPGASAGGIPPGGEFATGQQQQGVGRLGSGGGRLGTRGPGAGNAPGLRSPSPDRTSGGGMSGAVFPAPMQDALTEFVQHGPPSAGSSQDRGGSAGQGTRGSAGSQPPAAPFSVPASVPMRVTGLTKARVG